MAVLERTEGGYIKEETSNGVIRHKDPNGHPVKQQAFAASKGGEATAEKYDTEVELGDDGKIKGSTKTPKKVHRHIIDVQYNTGADCKNDIEINVNLVTDDGELDSVVENAMEERVETAKRKLQQQRNLFDWEQTTMIESEEIDADEARGEMGEIRGTVLFEKGGSKREYEVDEL
jgi:hypothetical protein